MSEKLEVAIKGTLFPTTLQQFKAEYMKLRNVQDNNIIDRAILIAKAKDELSSHDFDCLLCARGIKIKTTQANKYVAIGRCATPNSRLIRFLKIHDKAFEKAYHLAMIPRENVRDELIELLNGRMLSVKKISYVVQLISYGHPPYFAYKQVKSYSLQLLQELLQLLQQLQQLPLQQLLLQLLRQQLLQPLLQPLRQLQPQQLQQLLQQLQQLQPQELHPQQQLQLLKQLRQQLQPVQQQTQQPARQQIPREISVDRYKKRVADLKTIIQGLKEQLAELKEPDTQIRQLQEQVCSTYKKDNLLQ